MLYRALSPPYTDDLSRPPAAAQPEATLCRRPPPNSNSAPLSSPSGAAITPTPSGGCGRRRRPSRAMPACSICSALCWRASNATGRPSRSCARRRRFPRIGRDTLQLRPGVTEFGPPARRPRRLRQGADEESAQRRRLVRARKRAAGERRHERGDRLLRPRAGDRPQLPSRARQQGRGAAALCGDSPSRCSTSKPVCASTRPSPPRTSARPRLSTTCASTASRLAASRPPRRLLPTSPRRGKRAPTFVASWVVSTRQSTALARRCRSTPPTRNGETRSST